jgi:8-oxo-dGTP pyrophosphatase MutT (NUDIX family)
MLRFLCSLDLTPSQVSIARSANTRRIVPGVEAAIESAWDEAMRRPGIHLFDGPMCRLESWTAGEDHLQLVISPSSYKAFFGTNMSHPEFADEFGADVMANPVGVSPALLSADGFLMFGRRNAAMAYYPGRLHPFAGCMEPSDEDVFAAVRRELSEELGLAARDIAEMRCIGIAEDRGLGQPELIFSVASTRTRAEIESQLDDIEHHGSWSVRANATEIEAAIGQQELTPVAVATLLLWGRVCFGDDWFASRGKWSSQ